MKKFFFSIFSFLFFAIIASFFYLAFFGYETNRFNETISDIVKKNAKNVDLSFEKVKISLELKKFSIFVSLTKPEFYYFKTLIPLDSLKADVDLFSVLTNKSGINKIIVDTKYINYKLIKPIILRSKPGNLKTILLNNVKNSKFKINSELKFNDNLELTKDSRFTGDVKETFVDIKKKYQIRDLSFDFAYKDQLLNLSSINAKLEDFEIYDSQLDYNGSNEEHQVSGKIKGKIDSSGDRIEKTFSLAGIDVKNFSFLSFKGFTSGSFNLKLDKTLAVKKSKFIGGASINEFKANLKEKVSSGFLTKSIENVQVKDTIIDIVHEDKKNKVEVKSSVKISDEFFKLDFSTQDKLNSFKAVFNGESPIKIPLMNYSSSKKSILNGSYNFDEKHGFLFLGLKYESGENLFQIRNLALDNKFNLVSFQKLGVVTKLNDDINNDFIISANSAKNKIKIKGRVFDSKFLAKELSKTSKNDFLKNISKGIEIDFDKILTDTDFPLKKFRLIGDIKKGKFEKISGKSEFIEGKYLDISLKKEKNSNFKILEIHSDVARPLINSYKFFDGLNQGNLIYESRFDDKNSTAILKISNFKLIKAPAFAKLLTLADFQGLTDTLKGEGISFDILVIKYTTDSKIMRIQEIFMIGPSISILIEGYVEQKSGLVSLRGTLVPAKTLNTLLSKIPLVGHILIGKKDGEGLFGVSFKMKGLPNDIKTTVNPVKTLTPRFITRALESLKKQQTK